MEINCPISNSDHNLILFKIACNIEVERRQVKSYRYDKGDYQSITAELKGVEWDQVYQNCSVEEMWSILQNKLIAMRDKFVPESVTQKRDYPKWLKKSIKRGIKKRNKAWKRYDEHSTYDNLKKYKTIRNKMNKVVKRNKREFEASLADRIKTDPKIFYSYVRSKTKIKDRIGPLEDQNRKLTNDNATMSEILNKYFASVYTIENIGDVPTAEKRQNSVLATEEVKKLVTIEINQAKVVKALKSMKKNKTGGVDGLNSSYIIGVAEAIIIPLTILFRRALENGEVPLDWKMANVTAIFKKGSRKKPENYRPVSLTSHIGKCFERIIKEEIVMHLETNNLIRETQHGFRNKKSCLTNLLEYSKLVAEEMDKGKPVDIIFLDFQKAFDKVPHERLGIKLKAHGIDGKVLLWIKEWLKDRKQRVVVNGENSSWEEVVSGVPQGSVLGPVLFTVFINDIDDGILSDLSKFADDTKLVGSAESKEESEVIQGDLNKLHEWSVKWQMNFNAEKCKVLHLGSKNKKIQYKIGGKAIGAVNEEKDLGVIVTDNFKVGKQCTKAANKGNQKLGMIKRTFACKDKSIMLKLYKSVVRPSLDYCGPAWRPHLRKDIDKLERVQKRATRMIEECKGKGYEERLKIVGLTTLETRRERADMLEVFKIMKGLEGLKERDFFVRDTNRGRGHSLKLYKKRVNLDIAKYSFGNRVCASWNKLSEEIVASQDINEFKGRLDEYLGIMGGLK